MSRPAARRIAALLWPSRAAAAPPALPVSTVRDRVIARADAPGSPPWDTPEAAEMRELYTASGLRDAEAAGTLSADLIGQLVAQARQHVPSGGTP